ncbi:MAG: hypothetical protein ACPIOQ_83215, partial [Promethearchaeia archaeon]
MQAPAPPGAPKDAAATPSMPEFKKDINGVKSSIWCLAVELEKTMTIVKRSVCKVGFSRRSPCSRDHSRMVDSEVNVGQGLTCSITTCHVHHCLLANLSLQQSLTSFSSQINSIDVRFADLQQRVFEMQALSDEVLQRLQAKNSQMEELVRATFNQGIARGDDVWIICASSRFAISPRRASE